MNGREIRLSRYWTQAGKFGTNEFDEIIVVGMFVVECFQYRWIVFGRVLGLLIAQQRDAAQFFGMTRLFGFP